MIAILTLSSYLYHTQPSTQVHRIVYGHSIAHNSHYSFHRRLLFSRFQYFVGLTSQNSFAMKRTFQNCEFWKISAACALPHLPGFYYARSAWFKKNLDEWYQHLNHPSYRPPDWLFGPVWGALYTGMGYASYLVYKNGGGFSGSAKLPLALYGAQLALVSYSFSVVNIIDLEIEHFKYYFVIFYRDVLILAIT